MAREARSGRMSFDDVVDVYHRVRPGYPPELFDDLFALLPARPTIIEVGPGTGQATRDLLRHGARVHAIELGPALAARLRHELPSPDLTVRVGQFERVPSGDKEPFDALFSATAYHWIDHDAQLDRPADLLAPGGLVAVVDLIQVDDVSDRGFFDAVQPIYAHYGQAHRGPPAPPRHDVDPPMRERLDGDARFDHPLVRCYDWDQTYHAAQYRQLMRSYSSTQCMPPLARDGLLDDIERVVEAQFGGEVTRPLVVTLTTAARTVSL